MIKRMSLCMVSYTYSLTCRSGTCLDSGRIHRCLFTFNRDLWLSYIPRRRSSDLQLQ